MYIDIYTYANMYAYIYNTFFYYMFFRLHGCAATLQPYIFTYTHANQDLYNQMCAYVYMYIIPPLLLLSD